MSNPLGILLWQKVLAFWTLTHNLDLIVIAQMLAERVDRESPTSEDRLDDRLFVYAWLMAWRTSLLLRTGFLY